MKLAIVIAAALGAGVVITAPVADDQSGLDCRADGFCDAAPQEFPASVCCSGHALNNCCVSAKEAYKAMLAKMMKRGEEHQFSRRCMPDGFFDAAPQEFPPSACCSGHVYHNKCVPARRFNVLKAREDTDAPCLPSNNCGINDNPPDAALKVLMDRETPPPNLLPPKEKRNDEFTTFLPIPASLLASHTIPAPGATSTSSWHFTHHMPIPVSALPINHPPRSEATITPSVKHVGPGWEHSLHHEPLPTTLITVVEG